MQGRNPPLISYLICPQPFEDVQCGGFEAAFDNTELSSEGLIEKFGRTQEIQSALLENYPDEPHADCQIWAVWCMEDAG